MSSSFVQPSDVSDPDWVEFESSLSELARLAKAEINFERFAQLLLDQTVHMLAAVGGAVWLGPAPWRLVGQLNLQSVTYAAEPKFNERLLEEARQLGEMLVIPAGGGTIGGQELSNPTDYILLIGPIKADQEVLGCVEIIQRPTASAAAIRGNRRLLALVCELAVDSLRRQELRHLRDEHLRTQQFNHFTAQIHSSLDVRSVAYQLVNLGREIIDCDRVSMAIRKGRRFALFAVSGVDTINRRSNAVRRLEDLATRSARARETIWYDGENDPEIAPQILESLRQYSDEAHPRVVGVIPLAESRGDEAKADRPVFAVLIVEQFKSVLEVKAREQSQRIAEQGSLAIANALRHEQLPMLPFMRSASRSLGQPAIRRTTFVAIAAAAVAAALLCVPVEFNIDATGTLQPVEFLHVFAPFEAQVASIQVQHDDEVETNDVLIELRSNELDLERQRIQGEFDVTQKRIATIESTMLEADKRDKGGTDRTNELVAEKEELLELLASQKEQLSLLNDQRKKLSVRSPLAGQVLTWNLEQLLANRPVQRGQQLLSVANLRGQWVAELEIPDGEVGYVLQLSKTAQPLRASFQLATNRGVDYEGTIRRISTRTEASTSNRPVVRALMDVHEVAAKELRPGATIFAKIHCGKRSAAYVLFHDVVEKIMTWLRF